MCNNLINPKHAPSISGESLLPEASGMEGSPHTVDLRPAPSSVFISDGLGSFDSTTPVHTIPVDVVLNTVTIHTTTAMSGVMISQATSSLKLVQSMVGASENVSPSINNDAHSYSTSVSNNIQITITPRLEFESKLNTIIDESITELESSRIELPNQLQSVDSSSISSLLSPDINTQFVVPTQTSSLDLMSSQNYPHSSVMSSEILTESFQLPTNVPGSFPTMVSSGNLLQSSFSQDISPDISGSHTALNTPALSDITQSLPLSSSLLFTESTNTLSQWNTPSISSSLMSYSLHTSYDSIYSSLSLPITPEIQLFSTTVDSDSMDITQSSMDYLTISFDTMSPTMSPQSSWPSTLYLYDLNETLSLVQSSYQTEMYMYSSGYQSDLLALNSSTLPDSMVISTFPYESTAIYTEASSLLDWNVTETMQYVSPSLTLVPQSTPYSDAFTIIEPTVSTLSISPTATVSSEYLDLVYTTVSKPSVQPTLFSSEMFLMPSSLGGPSVEISQSSLELVLSSSLSDLNSLNGPWSTETYVRTTHSTPTPFLTTVQPVHSPVISSSLSPPYSTKILPTQTISTTVQLETVSPTTTWLDNTTHAYDNATDSYNYTTSTGKMIVCMTTPIYLHD